MGFLDFLSAGARGLSTGLQTHDALKQRDREQEIADEEREADTRRRVLEEAILNLDMQRGKADLNAARQGPQPTYGMNADGNATISGATDPAQIEALRKRMPPRPTTPELPYAANVDGLSARFATADEAARFRDEYSVPDEPEGPASLPAGVQAAMANNRAQVSRIDQVIRAIEARPQSLGARFAVLPEMISQRTDPEGVSVRAMLADIGSMVILQRSGAAVAVQEMERLKPFLPAASDTPEAAVIKLRQLQQGIQQVLDETGGTVQAPPGIARPPARPTSTVGPLASGYGVPRHPENPYR